MTKMYILSCWYCEDWRPIFVFKSENIAYDYLDNLPQHRIWTGVGNKDCGRVTDFYGVNGERDCHGVHSITDVEVYTPRKGSKMRQKAHKRGLEHMNTYEGSKG